MDDDWEQLAEAGKVPAVPKVVPKVANKWDGEDEDDVKDSWDAESEPDEEEKKDEEKVSTPVKPKQKSKQKIAEKERLKLEEAERKRREREEENMTPEERAAEKLRLQRLQEEVDLKLALETLGVSDSAGGIGGIDGANPKTAEEFTALADAICKKVLQFKLDEEFSNFSEELIRNICAALPSIQIRKIKTSVDNLYLEKQKLEKGDKPKKAKGGKVKARLRVEGDSTKLDDYVAQYDGGFDEYEDFM